MIGAHAQTVRLSFAILDGSDPKIWTLFGKRFPVLLTEACAAAQLEDVSPELLQDYSVEVDPIWSGPTELLKETTLDRVVGVIVDAFPKPNAAKDQDEKVDTLRRHVQRVHHANRNNADALFRRFRYSVWFMTDKTANIAAFKDRVLDTVGNIIGKERLEYQVFKEPDLLPLHLTSYMDYIYFRLGRE
jgi:hypothetical protein